MDRIKWLCLLCVFLSLGWTGARADSILSDRPDSGIVREMGYFPAADGTRLAYVVYRPDRPGPYPTVAWIDVYGAGSMPLAGMVRNWVAHGYAFVAASIRGTGCSGGDYVPFGAQDAKDGVAFIEWAARQEWSNGRVGLVGNSQPGIVQFGIAALQPKHLVAIAPGGTVRSIYGDGWYLGGIYNAAFAAHWSRYDQPGASRARAEARIKLGDEECKARAARIGPNSLPSLLQAHPYDDEYYQRYSPYDRAPEVTVPALMVQSWTDPAVGSTALGVFSRLKAQYKRLFVLSGGHDAYFDSTAQDEVVRWMDRWVREQRNGIEREPRVRIDFGTELTGSAAPGDIAAAKAGWTQTLADWPAPDTQWRSYYFGADGTLGEARAAGTAAAPRQYFYPAGTELPGSNGQFEQKALDWGSLTYRSKPVDADIAILGAPQVLLYASAEQANTDFMVVLHDVSPAGDVTFVQRVLARGES